MNNSSISLSVKNVTVSYRNGHRALWNASFEIPYSTITALVGVNGAGKSTLFKATEEVDWSFPVLVKDVVMMGRYGHMGFLRIAKKSDHFAVEEALSRVGMLEYSNNQIGELSGGQRKRVFLARAIAQEGKTILLDEPFTGIDVKTEDQIINLLNEFRKEGKVMLISTHNLGSVPEFCDRSILIKGTILKYGLTENVFTRENLENAFGGVLRHFSLGGRDLHEDGDKREVSILTDDERPFVQYGNVPLKKDKK